MYEIVLEIKHMGLYRVYTSLEFNPYFDPVSPVNT